VTASVSDDVESTGEVDGRAAKVEADFEICEEAQK